MEGEVHDPRAYAVGGVAGHAGLFSTANDLAIYSQMMIEGGTLGDAKIFTQEIVDQMTKGYDVPGGSPDRPWERGLGWDKRTGYSSNRGESMTASAFGHGGFTGTSLWIDPELELFVIFLSNRVHPDGAGSVNAIAGAIGKVAADAARAARVPSQPDA
jgi:CubicO group peptidase (beta-lactamase class C family)